LEEPGAYFHRLADLGGRGSAASAVRWDTVNPLEVDVPVRREDLKSPVSLQKGSLVTLIARNHRLQVRALGRVREALEGGSVSVENLDSKKVVVGRPLNSSEVEIVF
jgi:flagella basal body P-ring formation protein FlgA